MDKREKLAQIAYEMALKPFHGYVMTMKPNLDPIINLFPPWPLKKWDKKWCAAFVYYCCRLAGFEIPVRYPDPKIECNFAGCYTWEQWAKLECNNFYFSVKKNREFIPQRGDIVLYDKVFDHGPHDHIGIIIENREKTILVAEGNVNNISAVIEREKNSHIRGFIRIPNDYIHK
jgi:hypothetical protein